jgi:UDP-N-acetylglucosamine--N-acetylmuramyl-(pentapeptide) pyrophosphoryl-undecaprenol N-acetylglucosamine transferase
MKFIVAAGGTGGHFFPGLAVARALIAQGHHIFFVIKKGDYVRPLLEREKIPYWAIHSAGLKRRLAPSNLLVPLRLVQGFAQSLSMLRSQRPDALLVMGGYLSVPPALAARALGIPVVLHEQNVVPGLANKMLSRLAARVAVSFEPGLAAFGDKSILTGNPVRAEFGRLPALSEARARFHLNPTKQTLLVFGGSLGARRLNELITGALARLESYAERVQVLHITGANDVDRMRERYGKLKFESHVDGFCHDMPAAYAACDGVIARAGASTVAELLVVRKPALLVPYPLATDGHQTANANVLKRRGLADVREQRDLTVESLAGLLEMFFKDPDAWRHSAAEDAQEINPMESALRIASILGEVGSKPR